VLLAGARRIDILTPPRRVAGRREGAVLT